MAIANGRLRESIHRRFRPERSARQASARPFIRSVSLVLLMGVLSGCAGAQFQVTGQVPRQPLCQLPGEQISALVLWGPRWRPDQKEILLREAAAQRGLEQFFAAAECFAQVRIIRKVGSWEAIDLTPEEIQALAANEAGTPGRILIITVRELGPLVKLFSSGALVEGGTEVVLNIRAVSPATGQVTADFRAHWQHGGPWVIKGVATLDQDLASALQEALRPANGLK